jgi:hypothetical protein
MSEQMLPQPDVPGAPPVLEPKRIRVFGIIHIVFGGMGLLHSVFGAAMMFAQEWFTRLTTQGQPEELIELQLRIQKEMAVSSWISLAIGVVVSILILRAGIGLVRRKKAGLRAANTYAWVSLAAKVVTIIIFFLLVNPLLIRIFDEMIDPSDATARTVLGAMKVTTTVAGMITPVIAAIYPLVSLVMLNKQEVKDYLELHGN